MYIKRNYKKEENTATGNSTKTVTTLWTNSAPSSSFEPQEIRLSESIRNFDYIEFTFNRSTSYTSTLQTITLSTEAWTTTYTDDTYYTLFQINYNYTNRIFRYTGNYYVNFGPGTGTAGANNTLLIPVSIKGIKYQ